MRFGVPEMTRKDHGLIHHSPRKKCRFFWALSAARGAVVSSGCFLPKFYVIPRLIVCSFFSQLFNVGSSYRVFKIVVIKEFGNSSFVKEKKMISEDI